MRLTGKHDDNSGYEVKETYAYEQHLYIDLVAYEKCIHKLGPLEDIEDELGVELIKICLFAMNGGYYKGESPLAQPTDISPNNIEVNFLFKYFNCYESCLSLYFNDYGKTWALTKEELNE